MILSNKNITKSDPIAVVGAGVSGTTAAHLLREQGYQVSLFDKGRRLGGRSHTRVRLGGQALFDHGSTVIDQHPSSFSPILQEWAKKDWVVPYEGHIRFIRSNPSKNHDSRQLIPPIWSSKNGMSGLVEHLAEGLDIHTSSRIIRLLSEVDGWWLEGEMLREKPLQHLPHTWGPFQAVILAMPGPQVAPMLFSYKPEWVSMALSIKYQPQWVACCLFDQPISTDYDFAFYQGHQTLKLASREQIKYPHLTQEMWVLQSQYAWAKAHLEIEKLEAATLLLEAFRTELGSLPAHTYLEGHRWRYSHPLNSQTPLSLFDRESKIGLCGDWLGGASIGAAYTSGKDLVDHIMQSASS